MKGTDKKGKHDQGNSSLGIVVIYVEILEELLTVIISFSIALFKEFFKWLVRRLKSKGGL